MEKPIGYQINDELWVKVLMDIHVAEAAAQQGDIATRDSLRQLYYHQIFEIHDVSKELYEVEMERLKKDPTKLNAIYDQVIHTMKERKKEL